MSKCRVESDERFMSSLAYIVERMEQCEGVRIRKTSTKKRGAVEITLTTEEGESQIEARNILFDAISDIIVTDCKSHYILENMRLPVRDLFDRHVFLCALCEFDREMDKYLVLESLEVGEVFLLDSFYDFRLGNLKKRWDEICLIANENIENLVVEGNFFELLRYLISNLEQRTEEVFLECIGDTVTAYDRQMRPIEGIYTNRNLKSCQRAISILVATNPRRILFWGEENEFFEKVRQLFTGVEYVEIAEGKEKTLAQ